MRVSLFIAAILAIAFCPRGARAAENQTLINANIEKWINVANAQLSALGIEAFGSHFTPDYLATRTRQSMLEAQQRRFRGQLGIAIAESLDDHVYVCPAGHVSDEAAQNIVAEMKKNGFDAHWIKDRKRCGQQRLGYAYVKIPPPTAERSAEETLKK